MIFTWRRLPQGTHYTGPLPVQCYPRSIKITLQRIFTGVFHRYHLTGFFLCNQELIQELSLGSSSQPLSSPSIVSYAKVGGLTSHSSGVSPPYWPFVLTVSMSFIFKKLLFFFRNCCCYKILQIKLAQWSLIKIIFPLEDSLTLKSIYVRSFALLKSSFRSLITAGDK